MHNTTARAQVGLSYLIKINSAQLVLNDIQYFLHWVSFNIHQQHLLLQYIHSTLLLPGHYPLHLEEKTVVGVSVCPAYPVPIVCPPRCITILDLNNY